MEPIKPIPVLDAEEQRVLGALIEKSRTTPDNYPLTLNALSAACNQKTSRHPIVQFDDEIIINTLDRLKKKGLVATASGGSSRVIKYKHNLAIQFPLVPAELAILCLLLLRGPLTPGEINNNSSRLYEFESLEEVNTILQKLSAEEMSFVSMLERQAGQKEQRYQHLLGVSVTPASNKSGLNNEDSALAERVGILETELKELKAAFDKLMMELS